MSVKLEIPKDPAAEARIMISDESQAKRIDMRQISDSLFMLRADLGVAAKKVGIADREMMYKYGILAHSIAALQALKDTKQVTGNSTWMESMLRLMV
jgi:diacylglycerol kinase family enzyme